MLIRGKVQFQLKQESSWGYHTWVRFARYSSAESAWRAVKSLRRNGWFVDTAYPASDHSVVAVKPWDIHERRPRIRYPKSKTDV